jgi:hypothetical protein
MNEGDTRRLSDVCERQRRWTCSVVRTSATMIALASQFIWQ